MVPDISFKNKHFRDALFSSHKALQIQCHCHAFVNYRPHLRNMHSHAGLIMLLYTKHASQSDRLCSTPHPLCNVRPLSPQSSHHQSTRHDQITTEEGDQLTLMQYTSRWHAAALIIYGLGPADYAIRK